MNRCRDDYEIAAPLKCGASFVVVYVIVVVI